MANAIVPRSVGKIPLKHEKELARPDPDWPQWHAEHMTRTLGGTGYLTGTSAVRGCGTLKRLQQGVGHFAVEFFKGSSCRIKCGSMPTSRSPLGLESCLVGRSSGYGVASSRSQGMYVENV